MMNGEEQVKLHAKFNSFIRKFFVNEKLMSTTELCFAWHKPISNSPKSL